MGLAFFMGFSRLLCALSLSLSLHFPAEFQIHSLLSGKEKLWPQITIKAKTFSSSRKSARPHLGKTTLHLNLFSNDFLLMPPFSIILIKRSIPCERERCYYYCYGESIGSSGAEGSSGGLRRSPKTIAVIYWKGIFTYPKYLLAIPSYDFTPPLQIRWA